jgi:hypothetical protein
VANELERFQERASKVLELGYSEVLNSGAEIATMDQIGPQLDPPLQVDNFEDQEEFRKLARYLAGEEWIENCGDGFLMFTITPGR